MEDTPLTSQVARGGSAVEPPLAGSYAHHLDAKGRLVLPAALRVPFEGQAYVTPWEQGQCLAMWTTVGYRQLTSWVRRKGVAGYRAASGDAARPADLMRAFHRLTIMVRPDGQGRLVLPGPARDGAAITHEVEVVGHDDHLELWSPTRLDERERGAAPMAEVMFEDYEHEDH